jgi:catechol 2,3-dioxygenase-like lactoylglutathione lyase family enzyme
MIKFVCPLILVEDMAVSRRFYEDCLGQKARFDFGVNLEFEGHFALYQKAHYETLLGDPQRFPITLKSNWGELYFEAGDIDDVHHQLQLAGAEFIHGVKEEPWGQRTLRVYDPDGHIIDIGESLETTVTRMDQQGVPVEGIMQKTGLPREFVEGVLGKSDS